jgi:hypothetical protein
MKTRASKLDAHAADLEEWFGKGMTLAEAKARLHERGVETSLANLSNWWSGRQERRVQEQVLDRIASGAAFNDRLAKSFSENPPPNLEALISLHRVIVMQLSVHGVANPNLLARIEGLMKSVMQYEMMRLKKQELDLDARRVELLEAKAKQADAAAEVIQGNLTPEEKATRIKEIFGLQ